MKLFALIAATLSFAGPALAQNHSNHVPAPAAGAQALPAAPAVAAAKFSLDTPIATLMGDPAAKAVVEASLPNIQAHPSYEQAKSLSFNQVAPMAPDMFSAELLAKLQAGLTAIK